MVFDKLVVFAKQAKEQRSIEISPIIDDMCEQEHAYLGPLSELEVMAEEERLRTGTCDYALSTDTFFMDRVAFAFPDNSPWVQRFNEEIRRMLQSGLIMKWKRVDII